MLTCPACGRANPAEARFCNGCGGPLGAGASAREVRKTVTALFCDLVGSTTLGETHDPEVLRPLLERYFAAARGAIERHGGRVEKYIGDAVSAVFGLPVAHEDDALRAVRAAMEIQVRLAELAAGSPFPFTARVGVTTGEVLVPGDGTPLIGDAMNTAARLQAAAEPGTVLIGEPTWRLVRDAVVAEPVEPLSLRGKAEPIPAYRVVAVASLSPMRTRRLDAPMVGRRREAALLESAFARAASDRACQLFTVLGSAGAGKSRLVEEFLAAHGPVEGDGDAAADGTEVLRGRCLPYGEGITWYPVTEALRGALGLPDFEDAATVTAAIHAAVGEEEHAPLLEANLARLFAAGEGGSPEETFWAIRRFLESRGREHPLVLVLDDIHWGEPTFLDFVEHVADWSRDASILLLAMARPDLLDVRPAWGGGKTNATTISLAPLTDAECGQLIEGLAGSSALPPEVRSRITAVAEGNPLFVEEMLRMLVDDGRLVREGTDDGEQWVASGDLADVHVPPTISALLSARLDRLSDDERAVVEAAAVAGKEFHRGALLALLPEAARQGLPVHLRSLVRRELVTPERSTLPGEDAYRFRHLLIRDAAYDAIPKADRAGLHVAFADWLEGVAGDRVIEQEEIVGHHLERAYRYREDLGLPEDRELRLRAARALGAAGARALDAGDVRAATELLRPAADLAAGDSMELEVLMRLSDALDEEAKFEEAGSVIGRLVEVARTAGDPVSAMRVGLKASWYEQQQSPADYDLDKGGRLAEKAIQTFKEAGAQQFLPHALVRLGSIEWDHGRMARALELTSEALDLTIARRDRPEIRACLINLLVILDFDSTPLSEAFARASEMIETFKDDRAILSTALLERALMAAWLGRADEARDDLEASRAIAEELGRRWDEQMYPVLEGYVTWFEHGPSAAEATFREGRRLLAETGDRVNVWFSSPPLARVLLAMGRNADAEEVLLDLREIPLAPARIQGLTNGAVIAARRGDHGEALRLSREAEAFAAATDLLWDQADVALDKAEILLLAGRPAEARAAAEDALARFERKEHALGIRRVREFLAALPG